MMIARVVSLLIFAGLAQGCSNAPALSIQKYDGVSADSTFIGFEIDDVDGNKIALKKAHLIENGRTKECREYVKSMSWSPDRSIIKVTIDHICFSVRPEHFTM